MWPVSVIWKTHIGSGRTPDLLLWYRFPPFDSLENFHVTLQNMHFRKNNLSKPPSSVLLWKSAERQIRSRERNLSPWPLSQRLPLETPFAAQPHPSLQGLWKHWPRHIPWGTARKSSPDFFSLRLYHNLPLFLIIFYMEMVFSFMNPTNKQLFRTRVGGGRCLEKNWKGEDWEKMSSFISFLW